MLSSRMNTDHLSKVSISFQLLYELKKTVLTCLFVSDETFVVAVNGIDMRGCKEILGDGGSSILFSDHFIG